MVFILTGNGKGKTTAALGMGLRAVGAGKKVLMVRFLKPEDSSSEDKLLKSLPNFTLRSFGRKGFFLPSKLLERKPKLKKQGLKPLLKEDERLVLQAWELARKAAIEKKYEMLILDEVNIVLHFGVITKEEMLRFLSQYRQKLDVVLTGRYCPKEIIKIADVVTEMRELKHYYQKGFPASKGIEI